MTYRIDQLVGKISCPVICVMKDEKRIEFEDGKSAADHDFDKYYLIASIDAADEKILIRLEENNNINDLSWTEDKQISFFD